MEVQPSPSWPPAPGCCLAHLGGGPLGFARPCLRKEPLGGLGPHDPDDPDGCIGVTGCLLSLGSGVTRSTISSSEGSSSGSPGLSPMPGVWMRNMVRTKLRHWASPCFLLLICFCYYLYHLSVFFHSNFVSLRIILLGLECLLNPGSQFPPAMDGSSPDLPSEPGGCIFLATLPAIRQLTVQVSTEPIFPIEEPLTPPALPDFLFAVCKGGSFRGVPPLKECFTGVPPVKEALL